MDAKRFAIHGNPGALRHIGKMPDRTVFHLDHQVVALHKHNFAALNLDLFAALARSCGGVRLYLCGHCCSKCKTNDPTDQHQTDVLPIVSKLHLQSSSRTRLRCVLVLWSFLNEFTSSPGTLPSASGNSA